VQQELFLHVQANTLHVAHYTLHIAYSFSDRQFLINTKHKKGNSLNARRNFSCGKESARSGRILLDNNTGGGAVILQAISASNVLDFGFQVDCLAYLPTVDHYV